MLRPPTGTGRPATSHGCIKYLGTGRREASQPSASFPAWKASKSPATFLASQPICWLPSPFIGFPAYLLASQPVCWLPSLFVGLPAYLWLPSHILASQPILNLGFLKASQPMIIRIIVWPPLLGTCLWSALYKTSITAEFAHTDAPAGALALGPAVIHHPKKKKEVGGALAPKHGSMPHTWPTVRSNPPLVGGFG